MGIVILSYEGGGPKIGVDTGKLNLGKPKFVSKEERSRSIPWKKNYC